MNCSKCNCLLPDDEPTITHDTQRDCIIALYAVRGAAIESVRAIALEQGDDWLRKFAETHGLKVEKIKELL